MQLTQALRLSKIPRLAFVGSGGKTTAISILAKEIPAPLIITTTTHFGAWQSSIADNHIILRSNLDILKIDPFFSGTTLITMGYDSDRLGGLDNERIYLLKDFCDKYNLPLIIECDGSRQLPIKAPGPYEPVIPDFIDTVVVMSGLSGLNRPLNSSVVHHPDVYSDICKLKENEIISIKSHQTLLSHDQGGLKNIPPQARRFLILNQADTTLLQSQSFKLSQQLGAIYDGIIVSELINRKIHALFEPTAAIILAAGSSSRYGQTKQLLDYRGMPFLRSVALSAINANLHPIIIITGADSNNVENSIIDLSKEIMVVHNPNWSEGQSTSIRAGIETLSNLVSNHQNRIPSRNFGSVIFLLADQPQVTPAILLALQEEHHRTLAPVIAPIIDGRRGNPIIFDKATFTELVNLQGDMGGRGIFSKHPPRYIPWNDDSLLLDIDIPQDYERLLIG